MGSEHQAMLWASLATSPRPAGARRGREGRGRGAVRGAEVSPEPAPPAPAGSGAQDAGKSGACPGLQGGTSFWRRRLFRLLFQGIQLGREGEESSPRRRKRRNQ